MCISYGWFSKLNEITYERKRILSNKARSITGPIINNKHVHMEMVILGVLFLDILLPLVRQMRSVSVQDEQADILRIIKDAKKKVGAAMLLLLSPQIGEFWS